MIYIFEKGSVLDLCKIIEIMKSSNEIGIWMLAIEYYAAE